MSLVDYESSEDETEVTPPLTSNLKRKRPPDSSQDLPPLPSKFHDLYASTTRISTRDDPQLHGGRKRVTPHVEGNWPTHLFIEWYPTTTEHEILASLLQYVQDFVASEATGDQIESSLTSDLDAPLPLHVSLSRPIGFTTDRKDLFVSSLKQNIERSGVRPFNFGFLNLSWVPNYEKTRWFLVLHLEKPGGDSLNALLRTCNKTVEEFGQPPLYANPKGDKRDLTGSFHVSIGWTLDQPSSPVIEMAKKILDSQMFQTLRNVGVDVEEIKAKVGNAVTSIKLPVKVSEEKAFFT